MTRDYSPYENKSEIKERTRNGITFGLVTAVYREERLVSVKTFLGGEGLDDHHIDRCQLVNLDANSEGDEAVALPRLNTIGIVFFIDGEPWFFGGIKGLNEDGVARTGDEIDLKLNTGDKILSTVAKNKVLVKSNGLIEIASKEALKRIYFPTDNQILDICSKYSLDTSGGKIEWLQVLPPDPFTPPLGTTVHVAEYRKDIFRSFIVVEKKGNIGLLNPADPTIINKRMGPGIPALPGVRKGFGLWELDVKTTGETNFKVGPVDILPSFQFNVQPTGDAKAENLASSMEMSEVGDITLKNLTSETKMTAAGDIKASNNFASVEIDKTGNIKVKDASGKLFNIEATNTGDIKVQSAPVGQGAQLTLSKGKVALGTTGPSELLDVVDKLIDQMSELTLKLATETHTGNLGYPTAPPTTAPDYIAINTKLNTLIKAALTAMKGSL